LIDNEKPRTKLRGILLIKCIINSIINKTLFVGNGLDRSSDIISDNNKHLKIYCSNFCFINGFFRVLLKQDASFCLVIFKLRETAVNDGK
jgi:hypothetical protein